MKKTILTLALSSVLAFSLDVNTTYLKSYNYEKICACSDAIKVLIPLYKKYPNGYIVNLRLGWLFFLNKKYKNAILHYKKALITKPYSMEANIGLIKSYLASEDYNSAIRIGNMILKTDYYNFYGNYYLILALKLKKNYTEAKKIINKMLALYPTSVIYLEQLAQITAKSNIKKAKEIYKNILILDPNNILAKEFFTKQKL